MNTEPKRQNLVFTRVFDAPVEQVWRAWTESEGVKQWWGPDRFTCPSARMDVRVGGTSVVCMRAPQEFGGQDMYNTWTYTRIVAPREFEYILRFAGKDGNPIDPRTLGLPPEMPREVRNLVAFKSLAGNKTEVTVTEFDWTAGRMMEMSRLGLEQCLDKMARTFVKRR